MGNSTITKELVGSGSFFTVETVSDGNKTALILTQLPGYNVEKYNAEAESVMLPVIAKWKADGNEIDGLIVDAKFPATLNDIILGGTVAARTPGSSYSQVNRKMMVSQSSLLLLAAKGMNTATFNNFPLSVFDTLEEALETFFNEK